MISRNALLNIALILLISTVITGAAIGVLAILERDSLPVSEINVAQPVFTPIQQEAKQEKKIAPITTPIVEPKIEVKQKSSPFKVEHKSTGSPVKQGQSIVNGIILSTDQERMQFLVDTRPETSSLPSDAAVKITFFEKQESYILKGRTIVPYVNQDFDLAIETGDYYLKDLVYDFCGTVNRIKSLQDYRWELNKDKLSLLVKYAGAITQKNSCG